MPNGSHGFGTTLAFCPVPALAITSIARDVGAQASLEKGPCMPASRSPSWQRALVILSGVTVAVVATAALYWAQKVLIPVALAVFFAFLLSPLVTRLQRRRVPRTPAVLLVVLVALLLAGGTGWLITAQLRGLAASMPQYTDNIKGRIQDLRELSKDSPLDQLNEMAKELGDAWQGT